MLTLNSDEKIWLEQYQQALDEQFPGLVQEMIIYGSKARGDARADSDLDMIVVIREGNRIIKKNIAKIGYELSIGTDAVPSIFVYTEEEKNYRIQLQSSFFEIIQEEGISVR